MWAEYWEHRRLWDGQSVCWHSGEQYLAEWHRAQALVGVESQIVHVEVILYGSRKEVFYVDVLWWEAMDLRLL